MSAALDQVLWLLRFARPASLRLTASVLARLVNLTLGAAALALPAWAIGVLGAGLPSAGLPGAYADAAATAARFAAGVLAALLGITLAKALARYAEQLLGHLAAFALLGELRVWILDRLVPQAPAITDGEGAARVQAVAKRDVDRIEVFFAHTIAPAVTALLIPVASVLVAWAAAGAGAAATLGIVQLLGLALPLLGAGQAQRSARASAAVRLELQQQAADSVRLREELIAFEAIPARLGSIELLGARLSAALAANGRRAGLRQLLAVARIWLGSLAVLLTGLAASNDPRTALPGVLLSAALVAGTAPALESVERLSRSLPAGLESTRRLRELAARPPVTSDPATEPPASAAPPQRRPVSVRLEAVEFTYPGRPEPTLRGVGVQLNPGEVVGVCGATGSGKSTIARLLQRHWDPQSGRVLIDGREVRTLPLAEVHRHIVVAEQQPFLLSASLRENVRLGRPGADDEQVTDALQRAGAAELLQRPGGLDAQLGQRGALLSGGQRQRVALARALLHAGDEGVLVLDEATSFQDAPTQARIVAGLRQRRGATLIVAHRLETLRDADRIHVVESGRIVQSGTWTELAAAPGPFRALLDAADR